jgi:Ca2+-binding RTX toxin-like protein
VAAVAESFCSKNQKGNDGPNLILKPQKTLTNIDAQGGNDIVDGDGLAEPGTGDDKIKGGDGNDVIARDVTGGTGTGDDKINGGKGNDHLVGNGVADHFKCGSGDDNTPDFNALEGDKATGNCETVP